MKLHLIRHGQTNWNEERRVQGQKESQLTELGMQQGRLYDEVESQDPDSFRHFWQEPHLFNLTGAETFYDLQQRAIETIEAMFPNYHQKQIAIVSHGALIKTVLSHVENLPMKKLWSPPVMHNCAHSIIEFEVDGKRRITQYADQPFCKVRAIL